MSALRGNMLLITGLFIYFFAACVSNDIYIPSMPYLRTAFHTSLDQVQNSMTAWYVGVCVPQLFLGPIADKIGHRKVMLSGCILFIFASIGCAQAQTVTSFTCYRFIQGLCVASLNITNYSTIRRYFDYHTSVKLFAWMNVVASSAPILGPILGGYFLTLLSWRIDFIFLVLICIPALALLYMKLPEISHLNTDKPETLKNIYTSILINKLFLANSLCYGCLMGALIAYLTCAPYVLIDTIHIPAQQFGFYQSPIFFMGMLGGALVSYLVCFYKTKTIKYIGLAIASSALTSLFILAHGPQHHAMMLFISTVSLFAFGNALCGSILSADAMDALDQHIGSGAALHSFIMSSMGALGSWLVGVFYNGQLQSAATIFILFNLLALCLYFTIIRSKKHERKTYSNC